MPAIILIIALVCLPVVVVGCILTAYLKVRRARIHDVEKANNIDGTRHINDHGIALRGATQIQERDIVPENVAPVAQPLPTETHEDRAQDWKYDFAEAPTYGVSSSHKSNSFSPVISIPDIQAPQPAYTHALSGRFNSTQDTADLMYGGDTRAADMWAKIDKRESLVGPKPMRAIELPDDEWEDIDLDDGEEWRKDKRPATPAGMFAIGDSEDEEDEEAGERYGQEDCRSVASAKAVPDRSSWSTTSGLSVCRGSDVTKQTLPSSLSRASSMREERATPSRRSSVVSRLRGSSRSESERSGRGGMD